MTVQVLNLRPDAGFWWSLWHYVAVVPFYAIRKWFALFLITTGTLYASAMFNMQQQTRWYARDVAALLKEREQLLKELRRQEEGE